MSIAHRLEQTNVVEPVHPFECDVLYFIGALPKTSTKDLFRLEKPVDSFE
jgi:hypothetical protein